VVGDASSGGSHFRTLIVLAGYGRKKEKGVVSNPSDSDMKKKSDTERGRRTADHYKVTTSARGFRKGKNEVKANETNNGAGQVRAQELQ